MHDTNNFGLGGLRQAEHWRRERASEVFSTYSAWSWFKRIHRAELIAAGVLIPGRGSRGDLVTPGIDAAVIEIMRREAQQVVAA